jgi:hypothetical protein
MLKQKSDKPRSPLKARPLRYAGQSLDGEIQDLLVEGVTRQIVWSLGFVLVASVEWIRWFSPSRQMPVFTTALALAIMGYSAFKIRQTLRHVELLKMARDGEKVVGECLDVLRGRGYAVLHDIVGDGFNLDHVILAPHGIFTVETKTRSKPVRGDARVVYDGDRILVNGREPDRNPVKQAEAQATWLHNLLKESTGKPFPIKAAVVFPGWFVEQTARAKGSRVWVLNPKALPTFIENEPICIPKEDVHLATFHLSQYVRSR